MWIGEELNQKKLKSTIIRMHPQKIYKIMLEVYMIQGLCEHRIHFENIIEDITQKMHVQGKDQDNKHLEEGENPLMQF